VTKSLCHALPFINVKFNQINTALKYRPLKLKPDVELLEFIIRNDSSTAKEEFYFRYRSFLLQACRKGCAHFINGEQLADDIFQNTMIKAFNGMSNLFNKLSEGRTESSIHIKAWLSIIAKNELVEFLRKNPDEKNLANSFRSNYQEIEIPNESSETNEEYISKPSIEKETLDKGLATLSEREKDILMTYLLYQNPNEPNRHLPEDVLVSLCNRYNVSSDNLRQIKKRALLKLKKECGK
jgi:RNA polymerase sigma factor (sigma-70 family)